LTDPSNDLLDVNQLAALEASFHQGSAEASQALAKWIGKPSVVEIDSLKQLPLEEATDLLAAGDDPVCFCSAEMSGLLSGELILAFDDASGLALADMLLDRPQGTTVEWTEMATSAALETANILCCAYLNSLSRSLAESDESSELLPSPPRFCRDFAECLLEFALMGQAMAADQVILAQTRFEIDATPVNWTLLFVPDAESMSRLPWFLQGGAAER
jgi:chemotaxis protein CheC